MDRKKLVDLSNKTGIPEWRLKIAAGLPLKKSLATSVEEAKIEFFSAVEGSEEQEVALEAWIDLSTSVIDIKSAYEAGHDDSPAKKIAFLKWKGMVLSLLEMSTTVTKEMKVRLFTPCCPTKAAKKKLLKSLKSDELALDKVNNATELEEVLATYNTAPVGSEARPAALIRMIEFA